MTKGGCSNRLHKLAIGFLIICSISFNRARSQTLIKIAFKDMTLTADLILGNSKDTNLFFAWPISVAVDKERRIYVADYLKKRISVFSEGGEFVKSIGENKKDRLKLLGPTSITFDEAEILYIVDSGRNSRRILSLSKDNQIIRSFSPRIPPRRIFVSNKTLITLNRVSENNILIYSLIGELIAKYDDVSNMEETEARTWLTLDNEGSLYCARAFIPVVKKYSAQGKQLMSFEYKPNIANKKEPIQINRTSRGNVFTFSGSENPVCLGIAIDKAGFIYLLTPRDHDQLGLCSLWRFSPEDQSSEVVDLPFKCGQIYIDKFNYFYFIGWEEFPYVFRCHVEQMGKRTN